MSGVNRRDQISGGVRERGDRGHGIHDLMRQHAHQIALGSDLDGVELTLDRLDRDDLDEPAEPVDGRRADHRRLRNRVEDDRHEAGASDR